MLRKVISRIIFLYFYGRLLHGVLGCPLAARHGFEHLGLIGSMIEAGMLIGLAIRGELPGHLHYGAAGHEATIWS
jgi:hypothetical protein